MTAFPPPNVYFNGIIYDSDYFTHSSSGLTLSQANAKYLQKTVQDTASALETFSGGIKTNVINPTTTGGTIQIGHGSTTNNVEIASEASRSVVLHLGDGNTSSGGIHIGNGNDSSGNVQILNGTYALGTTAGSVNILTGTNNSFSGGNMNLFTTLRGTLTVGGTNNTAITFNKSPTFTAGVTTDTIASYGGFGGTIYTDPGVGTQTYTTLVCQNNSTCSFGGSSGTCNLGGLSSGVNIGFNMPTGQITIATAGTQDTNIAIATRGVYPVGTNKILIGASANTTTLSSGTTSITSATINLATTADSAISIGNSAAQSSNILIGTKAAFITGTNKIVLGASTNTVSLSGGTINVNTPLSAGYSYPITTNTQIGYTESPTITWFTTGLTTMATSTVLPIGNYVMTFSISTNGPYTGNLVYFASNVFSAELDAYRMGWTASGPYNCVSGSYVFCNTVARNIQLMNLIGNAQTFAFGAWNIIRIS